MNWRRDGADWPHRTASQFHTLGKIRWHVQDFGTGPVILLLHGTGAATHTWRHILEPLAQNHRVIALDLPGQGFSVSADHNRCDLKGMSADIAALLAHLHLKPDLIIGHSAGAAIALQLALHLDEAPRKIVSINGALEPFHGIAGAVFPLSAKLMTVGSVGATLVALTMSSESFVRRLIESTGSHIDPFGIMLYRRLVADAPHVDGTIAMMARWELHALCARAAQITAQTLLMVGALDKAVAPQTSTRWEKMLPNASLITEPDSGHLLHEENEGAPFLKHLDAILA